VVSVCIEGIDTPLVESFAKGLDSPSFRFNVSMSFEIDSAEASAWLAVVAEVVVVEVGMEEEDSAGMEPSLAGDVEDMMEILTFLKLEGEKNAVHLCPQTDRS
jgi:hypothetical protein